MQAKSELKNPRPATDADEAVATERKRIESRRDALGVRPVATHADSTWGLALSGGGIRSATFSLGVLQALARAAPAETSASAQASSAATSTSTTAATSSLAVWLTPIEQDTFTITDSKTGTTKTVAYADVNQIEAKHLPTWAYIAIGAGIGFGILVAVLAITFRASLPAAVSGGCGHESALV